MATKDGGSRPHAATVCTDLSTALSTSTEENEDGCTSETETVLDSDTDVRLHYSSFSSRSSSSSTLCEEVAEPFSTRAPVYAYPAKYPPDVEDDPFPCRSEGKFSFANNLWERRPAICTASALALEEIDIDSLVLEFDKLNLASSEPKDIHVFEPGPSQVTPFITITPSAPLPSLVNRCRLRQRMGHAHPSYGRSPPSKHYIRSVGKLSPEDGTTAECEQRLTPRRPTYLPWRMPFQLKRTS